MPAKNIPILKNFRNSNAENSKQIARPKNKFYIAAMLSLIWPGLIFGLMATAFINIGNQPSSQSSQEPSAPFSAAFPQCAKMGLNTSFIFDPAFERAEYRNHLLILHLRLRPGFTGGDVFNELQIYRPDCSLRFFKTPGSITFPPKLQLFSLRFDSPRHFDYWDDEQDQLLGCAACSVDLPVPDQKFGLYSQIAFDGSANNFNFVSSSFAMQDNVAPREPILIIPGLMGSELALRYGGMVIWPDLSSLVVDSDNNFLSPLDISPGGQYASSLYDSGVVDKIDYVFGAFHYTDQLVDQFVSQGYSQDKDLFLISYDWRMGLGDLAETLNSKISKIFGQTGALKVNIVAHSYGGLVLKEYLLNISGQSAAEDKIDKIIFVGVPHLGSAEAFQDLVFGTNFGIPLVNADKIRQISQNMPSIYSLLPGKEYFKHIAGYYDDLANTDVKNILNYDQTKQLLLDLGKNKSLLDQAEQFHSEAFDNFDFGSKKYTVYDIVGCGEFTLKTIMKMYSGKPALPLFAGPKYRIFSDSGDGTVLAASAAHVNIPQQNIYFAAGVEHSKMLSANGLRQFIAGLAVGALGSGSGSEAGATVDSRVNISSNSNICSVQGRLISLKSDVDIVVRDTKTNQIVDNKLLNIRKTGEDIHVFLPTSEASYKISVRHSQPGQSQDSSSSSTGQIGQAPPVQLALNAAPIDIALAKVSGPQTTIVNYDQININNSIMEITVSDAPRPGTQVNQSQPDNQTANNAASASDNNDSVRLVDDQSNTQPIQPTNSYNQDVLLNTDANSTPTDQSQQAPAAQPSAVLQNPVPTSDLALAQTDSPTLTPTPTPAPTSTSTPTLIPVPTQTSTQTPTITLTPNPTLEPNPTPGATTISSPTATVTPTPTPMPTFEPIPTTLLPTTLVPTPQPINTDLTMPILSPTPDMPNPFIAPTPIMFLQDVATPTPPDQQNTAVNALDQPASNATQIQASDISLPRQADNSALADNFIPAASAQDSASVQDQTQNLKNYPVNITLNIPFPTAVSGSEPFQLPKSETSSASIAPVDSSNPPIPWSQKSNQLMLSTQTPAQPGITQTVDLSFSPILKMFYNFLKLSTHLILF